MWWTIASIDVGVVVGSLGAVGEAQTLVRAPLRTRDDRRAGAPRPTRRSPTTRSGTCTCCRSTARAAPRATRMRTAVASPDPDGFRDVARSGRRRASGRADVRTVVRARRPSPALVQRPRVVALLDRERRAGVTLPAARRRGRCPRARPSTIPCRRRGRWSRSSDSTSARPEGWCSGAARPATRRARGRAGIRGRERRTADGSACSDAGYAGPTGAGAGAGAQPKDGPRSTSQASPCRRACAPGGNAASIAATCVFVYCCARRVRGPSCSTAYRIRNFFISRNAAADGNRVERRRVLRVVVRESARVAVEARVPVDRGIEHPRGLDVPVHGVGGGVHDRGARRPPRRARDVNAWYTASVARSLGSVVCTSGAASSSSRKPQSAAATMAARAGRSRRVITTNPVAANTARARSPGTASREAPRIPAKPGTSSWRNRNGIGTPRASGPIAMSTDNAPQTASSARKTCRSARAPETVGVASDVPVGRRRNPTTSATAPTAARTKVVKPGKKVCSLATGQGADPVIEPRIQVAAAAPGSGGPRAATGTASRAVGSGAARSRARGTGSR